MIKTRLFTWGARDYLLKWYIKWYIKTYCDIKLIITILVYDYNCNRIYFLTKIYASLDLSMFLYFELENKKNTE